MSKIITPFTTTIIHNVRKRLGISLVDYLVADCINFICAYKNNFDSIATGNYRELIADTLGIGKNTVQRSIENLLDKKLIENKTRKSISITNLWQEAISNYSSSQNGANIKEDKNAVHPKMGQSSYQNGANNNYNNNTRDTRMSECPKSDDLDNSDFDENNQKNEPHLLKANQLLQKEDCTISKNIANGAAQISSDEKFAQFYAAYPKKEGKTRAKQAYKKLCGKHLQIMQALSTYKAKLEAENTQKQFIKLPATFLNCFEDYLEEEQESANLAQNIANGAAAVLCFELKNIATKIKALYEAQFGGDGDKINALLKGIAHNVQTQENRSLFTQNEASFIEDCFSEQHISGLRNIVNLYSAEHFEKELVAKWQEYKTKHTPQQAA